MVVGFGILSDNAVTAGNLPESSESVLSEALVDRATLRFGGLSGVVNNLSVPIEASAFLIADKVASLAKLLNGVSKFGRCASACVLICFKWS